MSRSSDECLKLNYFDPSTMPDGSATLVIGMRGSGKSTVCKTLMYYRRHIEHGVCVSRTERLNKFWGDIMPPMFIHNDFDPSITSRLFDSQEEAERGPDGTIKPVFAIYDDLMFDNEFLNASTTRELLMNGRHAAIFTLVTAQYCMGLKPALRNNFDFIILLPNPTKRGRAQYYEQFGGMFDSFREFNAAFSICTQNRGCMVIKQDARGEGLSDLVFWYRATPDLKFRLGGDKYWRFAKLTSVRDADALRKVSKASGGVEVMLRYPEADPEQRERRKKKKKRGATEAETTETYFVRRKREFGKSRPSYDKHFLKEVGHDESDDSESD